MIHIDIYVAAADEALEFRCDEMAPIACVCEDVCEILAQKYGGEMADYRQFWLCEPGQGRILSKEKCLNEEQIMNGTRLIFL